MEFWNELVTGKSWEVLLRLRREPVPFTLIGGWAAYLWTRMQKSKDIDIVLEDHAGLEYLKQHFTLKKNDSLRKYEIIVDGIDIDIYVPYFSRLTLPAEDIRGYSTIVENIRVARPEALLVLKQGAEMDRGDSVKGRKDRLDIMALVLRTEMDWQLYRELLERYSLAGHLQRLRGIVGSFEDIRYLGLNPREFKLAKGKIAEIVRHL